MFSGKKCKYGDKLLNIGDSFEARAPRAGNVLCKCILPPLVTCYWLIPSMNVFV